MTTYQGMHGNYTILEPRLAQGGEGEIFKIRGRSDLVLKRFFDRHRTTTRLNKLQAQIAAGVPQQLLPQLTWPVDIVYENGQFIGYIMPALSKSENLNVIYSDKYKLTLHDRITIAMNLCVPVDALHQLGQYVGDGNPQNICVDPKDLTITLVDTDSYSITDRRSGLIYPCTVGLAAYLAPEVQVAMKQYHGLSQVPKNTFNEYTDRFWLAIHIFALLMNGAHPFAVRQASGAGIPNMSKSQSSVNLPQPNENICNGFFPHTMTRGGLDIPVYCPKFSYLPQTTQSLFIRAFVDGHTTPSARPSAREWFAELSRLQQTLVSGTRCTNRHHQYPSSASFCPWCELTQRTIPKHTPASTVVQNGGYGSGSSGLAGGGNGYGGGNGGGAKRNGCLSFLGILLGCFLSFALLMAMPVACTANLIDIGNSEKEAREEANRQKIEELRQQMEASQQQNLSDSAAQNQTSSPLPDSGMQADGTWVHPHDGRVLQVPEAAYQDIQGSVSDLIPETVFDLNPQVDGTYWLETVDSDQQLRIRVYDDSDYCVASYISEHNGHGTSMELTGGQCYTVKVERRFADTGNYHLRWWKQKPLQDITNYGSVRDAIEFNQQLNTYQFRCAATKNYRILCSQSDADLKLSIHVYDEVGNRLNSAINIGMGFGPAVTLEYGRNYYIHVNAYTGSGSYALDVLQMD